MCNHGNQVNTHIKYSTTELKKIYQAIELDNPELFFVNFKQVSFQIGALNSVVHIEYFMNIDETTVLKNELKLKIKEVFSHSPLKNEDSIYTKCRWIHHYLVKNIKYSYETLSHPDFYSESFRIDGVFIHQSAVCEGISKAFKILCNHIGIASMVVLGSACGENESQYLPHAWNIVKLGLDFVHIDATWDTNISQKSRFDRYDYFCISDTWIRKDHVFSNVPQCLTDRWSYFNRRNRVFRGATSLENYLKSVLNQGEKIIYFKAVNCTDAMEDVSDEVSRLVQKNVFYYLNGCYRIESMINRKQQCFFYRILE